MAVRRGEIRSYYEAEANRRLRGPLDGRRLDVRGECIAALRREGRESIVEIGAGPGLDGAAFVEAGFSFCGVDLAHENCRIASQFGVSVIQGEATTLPFRSGAFAAGWTMSTLMHLTDDEMLAAMDELARVVEPAGPCFVGPWGGGGTESVDDSSIEGQRRRFHRRSPEHNLGLMTRRGTVEAHEVWSGFPDDWEYHLFRVRL